jgi:hypothetical protein
MSSRWRSAATLAVLLLTSCASTRTIPADTQTLLAAALTPDLNVATVAVGPGGATVSYQEEGGLRVVPLSPTPAPSIAANMHLPSRSGDGFDVPLIVETAKNLVTTCKDDNQSTFARALSASATLIPTACGAIISTTLNSISSSVNGHPLTVLSGGWTLDNLKVLWSDLSVVVPDAKVTQILLHEDDVVFSFVSAMTACPQVWWVRNFNGTTSAQCASAFTGDLVDTTRFSPQRMLDAVSTAGVSLPSASPQSVLVIAYPESLQVTLARGNKQRIIEVAS